MNIDFSLILVLLCLLTGAITLLDVWYFQPERKREAEQKKVAVQDIAVPTWLEWPRSIFPVLLIVLIIRSFMFEPFRIPSGSLEPTLQIGDLIVVNKYNYGLRLPVINKKIMSLRDPKHGDIVVFRWPVDPNVDYIKRVIGVPGDHITYRNKVLSINGVQAQQEVVGYTVSINEFGQFKKVEKRTEVLDGVTHAIYVDPLMPAKDYDYTVPPGQYFVMGDNRDDSSDSRYWGFLPEENLLGKAEMVWMSYDKQTTSIRFDRIGKWII